MQPNQLSQPANHGGLINSPYIPNHKVNHWEGEYLEGGLQVRILGYSHPWDLLKTDPHHHSAFHDQHLYPNRKHQSCSYHQDLLLIYLSSGHSNPSVIEWSRRWVSD